MSSAPLGSTARECASAYDRWASDYDHCENKTRDLDGIALRAQDLDMAGKEVVEFGCGTGRHTKHFLGKFGDHIVKYTAMDASEGMLSQARSLLSDSPNSDKVTLLTHDLTRAWPLSDACADVMFGDLVLEHLQTLDFFFSEAARCLRRGGTLCVCEFHPFRQYFGGKANYPGWQTDGKEESVAPPCFTHDLQDFVRGGIRAGFAVRDLSEWRDELINPELEGKPPRILCVIFEKK